MRLNSNLGYYTNFVNLLDYAAVAVPAGFQNDGLPFGITLVAQAHHDTLLLHLAERLQQTYALPLGATAMPSDNRGFAGKAFTRRFIIDIGGEPAIRAG